MLSRLLSASALAVTLLFTAPAAIAQNQPDPAALLAEAEARLATDPADRKALVAAARASIVLKDNARAIRYLEQLRDGSLNFAVRQALLLQYATAQNWERHAAIQDDVLALFEGKHLPDDVVRREVFGLEQFEYGAFQVRAFRHFEPTGEHRHVFTSVVSQSAAPEEAPVMITFGSTVTTDNLNLERNPDRNYARLYSLDTHIRPESGGYSHETLGFETVRLDYPAYRQVVIDYLDGKLKPISSSGAPAPAQ
jgi:hypothetical protein